MSIHIDFVNFFQGECVVLRDRKLNIAPAIKKQTVVATNGAVYYATQPAPINNMPLDQFTAAAAAGVYPPGVPALYPQTMPYQPFYQYYSVPMVSKSDNADYSRRHNTNNDRMLGTSSINDSLLFSQNVPAIWPQSYQGNASIPSTISQYLNSE